MKRIKTIGVLCSLLVIGGMGGVRAESRANATEEFTLSPEGAGGLGVNTRNGAVRVTATGGDRIQIRAVKAVHADDRARADAFLREVRVDRGRKGERWAVAASWPDPLPRGIRSVSVAFEIQVPRGMGLEAQTSNGAIEAAGVARGSLRTSNGPVQAHDIGGPLDVRTSNGAIQIDGCAGPIQAETSNGRIEIRDAQRPVRAKTSNGAIRAEVSRADGAAQIDLQTSLGAIDLFLPEQVSARVDADTSNGRITIEPPGAARFNEDRTHAEAVLGDGKGAIRLRTSSGAIRIQTGSAE